MSQPRKIIKRTPKQTKSSTYMKSYFSFLPREWEILFPVLHRTIIYELRELLSSESKALIVISGAPKPFPCEHCFSAKYDFYGIPNQLDFCDFSSGHKDSKRSGSFWHSRKKKEARKHSNFGKSKEINKRIYFLQCYAQQKLSCELPCKVMWRYNTSSRHQ